MKKIISLLGLATTLNSFAQYGELENSSFENWTSDTSFLKLDQWSSSIEQNGGIGNNVVESSDAVDGNKSVYMETVQINQDTLFGYIMLGLLGQNGPGDGIDYTNDVDSIVGYWKYETMGDDSVTIITQQKNSGTPAFFLDKISGSQTTWQRFSYPLPVTSGQDSLMVAFASGNALNDYSVPGSWLMVDKVQLKSSNTYATDLPNYSFENWSPVIVENPDNWDSFNTVSTSVGHPSVTKSTSAYSGAYAAKLTNEFIPQYGDIIQGIITKGPIMNVLNGMGGISYGAEPTSFDGYYKYTPNGIDTARFNVVFYNNQSVVGGAYFEVNSTVSSYTAFSEMLVLSTTPDSMALAIFAGSNAGSTLYLDDINLSGGNVSITEQSIQDFYIYPTVTSSNITVKLISNTNQVSDVFVFSLEGKLMQSKQMTLTTGENTMEYNLSNLPTGSYIIKISAKDINYSGIVTKK